MYIRKKSSKKYLTPARRSRRQEKKQKIILAVIAAVVIVILSVLGTVKLNAFLSTAKGPDWLKWRVKDIKITGETKDMQYEVSKYIGFEKGDEITSRDCSNLEDMLLSNLKLLSSVKVKRNFFTKELNVEIKKHIPLAKIISESKARYLAQNGIIFDDAEPQGSPAFFPVHLKTAIKKDFLSQELVELISKINAVKDEGVAIFAAHIDSDAKTMNIEIKDTAFVQMGSYANAVEKFKKLAEILSISSGINFKKPYKIDFTYFDYGKIYLTPAV
jgi:cell division septal protein FtsQ